MADLPAGENMPDFKVGIIGCGQVGTVLLTKLLEVKE
jgi:acetaldehyde dehydrogenase (acetylating)